MMDEITIIAVCIAPVPNIASQQADTLTSCGLTMSSETSAANAEPYIGN